MIIWTSLVFNVLIACLNTSISGFKNKLIGIVLFDSHHHISPNSKNNDRSSSVTMLLKSYTDVMYGSWLIIIPTNSNLPYLMTDMNGKFSRMFSLSINTI